MTTLKLGKRGQITIPRDIRRRLGLRAGDPIAIIPQEGQAILRPITQTLLDLRGSVPSMDESDFEMIREQVKKSRGGRSSDSER